MSGTPPPAGGWGRRRLLREHHSACWAWVVPRRRWVRIRRTRSLLVLAAVVGGIVWAVLEGQRQAAAAHAGG